MTLVIVSDAAPLLRTLGAIILIGSVCLAVLVLWPGPRAALTFPATQDQAARARRELRWGAAALGVGVIVTVAAFARVAALDDWRQDPVVNVLLFLWPVPVIVATFFIVLGLVRRQGSRPG